MTGVFATAARRSAFIALAASGLAFAGAASAQDYPPIYQDDPAYYQDGITVYGRAPSPSVFDELSERVSYADLDLRTQAGVDELRWRVRNSANVLCADLGERPSIEVNTTVLPSCQQAAVQRASGQVMRAVRAARGGW